MYFCKHGTKWYYRMSVTLPDGTRKIVERAGGKTKAEARNLHTTPQAIWGSG